jgi:tyrosine-protein kinase Etk/Wzc
MNQVYEKKIFIENRMRAVEQEIERSKGALFEFTRQYGTVEISTQAQEQSKLIAQFQAEIIQNEIQIITLGAYFKETDQRIVRLKLENEKKREIISELKTKFLGGFVPLNMAPELSARYAEIQTNLNIQNELLGRLKKEYENVKIEEVNSLNNFQILERAEVPESKYAPSRSMICIIAAILAFVVSISIAFVREYIAGIRFDEGRSEKLNQIRRFLTPWRRR